MKPRETKFQEEKGTTLYKVAYRTKKISRQPQFHCLIRKLSTDTLSQATSAAWKKQKMHWLVNAQCHTRTLAVSINNSCTHMSHTANGIPIREAPHVVSLRSNSEFWEKNQLQSIRLQRSCSFQIKTFPSESFRSSYQSTQTFPVILEIYEHKTLMLTKVPAGIVNRCQI